MLKRSIKHTFRLNHAESELFKMRIKKSGLSLEAYVRHTIFGYVPTDAPPPDYFAMMKELHRIGATLKQIRHNIPNMEQLDDALAIHHKAVVSIINAVMLPRKIERDTNSWP